MLIITAMHMTNTSLAQLRLWQLISPSLPVGAYAYSGGLEAAIEAGWVSNKHQAGEWIGSLLQHGLGQLDVPVFRRLYDSRYADDSKQFHYWNDYILASRESAELQQEDMHLGRALFRLLHDLDVDMLPFCSADRDYSYVAMFACASSAWQIPRQDALHGLLWSWCENQVAAAIKLIPLGQTMGQQLLSDLQQKIPDCVQAGLALGDDDIGFTLPGLGIASAQHEAQYSRLFRS
jgi:urease accessory protein